jgi:HEAT repeat protein
MTGYRWTCSLFILACAGCDLASSLKPDNEPAAPGTRSPEVIKAFELLEGPAVSHHSFMQDFAPSRFIEGITPANESASRVQRPQPAKVMFPSLEDFYGDCPDAIELLIKTQEWVEHDLLTIAASEPRIHVRYRAARILVNRQCQGVLPFLADMSTSKDAVTRYVGVCLQLDAIEEQLTPSPATIDRILALYPTEAYSEIKEVMTRFLGNAKAKEAVEILLEQVRKDGDRHSVYALGNIGDPRAVPLLIEKFRKLDSKKVFDDPTPYICALGQLKTPESIDFLIEHLDSWHAPEALLATGSPKALPAMKAHLDRMSKQARDRDRDNIAATRVAIIRLSDSQPAAALLALAEEVKEDKEVRHDAIDALSNYPLEAFHPRLLALFNTEKDHYLRRNCITLLRDSKLDGVTAAFKRDLIKPRTWAAEWEEEEVQGSLMRALNKRLGTSFKTVDEMRAFLLNSSRKPSR